MHCTHKPFMRFQGNSLYPNRHHRKHDTMKRFLRIERPGGESQIQERLTDPQGG